MTSEAGKGDRRRPTLNKEMADKNWAMFEENVRKRKRLEEIAENCAERIKNATDEELGTFHEIDNKDKA